MGDVIFMTNVGSRDLKVPSIPSLSENTRKFTQHIKENINIFRDEIELPIILPSLIRISEEVEKIDTIILFVTNQEPPHRGDTLYSGEIIKEILLNLQNFKKVKDLFKKEDLKKFQSKLPKSKDFIRLKEIKKGVNDYDVMVRFYEDFFKKFKDTYKNRIKREISKIYISITGGIPACNMGLLWGAIKIFREKVIPLYVKEGTNHAFELKIGDVILESFIEETKMNFLKKRIFSGTEDFEKREVRKDLIKYIKERINFNFEKARKYLEKAEKEADDNEREYITKQFRELSEIPQPQNKLNELYFNLKYKYEMGEYVDFLGRVYSFLGNFSEYILNSHLKIPVKDEKVFSEYIKKNKDLYSFLSNRELRLEMNLRVYQNIIEYYAEKKGDEFLKEFLDYLNFVQDKLIRKRHKTIIAHGYEGCSLQEIEEDAKNFFDKTEKFLIKLGIYKKVSFIDDFIDLYK